MKIVETDPEKNREHILNNKVFVDSVVTRISNIIKNNEKFYLGRKLKLIESEKTKLSDKNKKLKIILSKAQSMKKDLESKTNEINSDNLVVRKRLLEMLERE